MNLRNLVLAAAAALTLSACGSSSEPAATAPAASPAVQAAYALGAIKKGDQGVCVVCVGSDHPREEAVAATVDFEGKTYAFCSEAEKAEFISNPGKYAGK